MQRDLAIETQRHYRVLDSKLRETMNAFNTRLAGIAAGFPVLTDWHPDFPPDYGLFPQVPVQRATIYRGNAETWAYSHHHTIAKFGDRFVASWSNGLLHEDYPGQEVHYAWSTDGLNWSEPQVLVHTPPDGFVVRNNAALYASEGKLYCYVGVGENLKRSGSPTMMSTEDPTMTLDVYETTDLENWIHHPSICDDVYLFEAPRLTQGGKLLVSGFNSFNRHTMYLIWDDPGLPAARPRVMDLPVEAGGVLAEQGTWFQTDDGRIWMWQRDGSISCRLGLCWSDDDGETWSDMLRTDFPNSFSRAYAGRLSDGRCFIVGNNYDLFLNRRHLQVALCDQGKLFDRQYNLVSGETTRRVPGRHKEDGWHYPNCLVDGDLLLTVYSVNKEDIEVCIADMSQVE